MTNTPDAQQTESRHDVWRMFDRIAHRYDLLNHLLSLGTDIYWRARVAKYIGAGEHKLADIATGTGDQLISLYQRVQGIHSAIGVDMSWNMLEIGHRKVAAQGLDEHITMVHGDALYIPLRDQSVTVTTITFGIRNVTDVVQGLSEMNRILKPGGRALILEFSLPSNKLFRTLYLFYFRNILPIIGGLISGDHHAYNYLNRTVETFPYGDAFCALMKEAGFDTVTATPLTFGIATIYCGEKH